MLKKRCESEEEEMMTAKKFGVHKLNETNLSGIEDEL
jgi:hypothetical protein